MSLGWKVEKHRVSLHHILKDVPYNGLLAVDNLLGALDRLDNAALDEFADDKRLVELGSHVLGNTTLAHIELRTDHDDRTRRIVDTLTEQILTETSLLALEAVAERLERSVGVTLDGARLARVVE